MQKKWLFLILFFIFGVFPVYAEEGLIEKEGKYYFIEEDGTYYQGIKEINGKKYYLNGTNPTLSGWTNIEDYVIYCQEDGSIATGRTTIEDNIYYFNEDGVQQTGFIRENDKIYFYSRVTGALKHGWQGAAEGQWYQLEDGSLAIGKTEIDGNYYYFNENGFLEKGFITENNKIYFYSRVNGALKYGWQGAVEGQWYQLEDGSLAIGKTEIDGNKYYFNENGFLQKGFITEHEKIYFYSRVNGALKYGWQGAAEGQWYQDNEGALLIGNQTIDNEKYCFNEKGFLEKGFVTKEDKKYYYDKETGILKEGWHEENGKKWYQLEDGSLLTGKITMESNHYYFDEDGFLKTGFIKENEKIYFYSKVTGALKYGWQGAAEGQWYQDKDGALVIGKQIIDNDEYYFNDEGIMQKGFVEKDGNKYFYSRVNGKLKHGWQSAAEGYWYQTEEGSLVKGLQTIDGREYKFDDNTGLLAGFTEIDGKKYYKNPDGTTAKGIQYMAERFWQFNAITGEFEKFVRQIRVIDVSAWQGKIDWDMVKASGQVDAVILRLGYGIGYVDKYFIRNKNELDRVGIPYSVYIFSYAENGNEALKESNFVVNTIKNNDVHIAKNIFGIYYDLEDWEIKSTGENSYGIGKETYRDMINTFVDNTEKNLCIKTRVYASKNYIETRFPEDVQQYATWVAQWNDVFTYQGAYEGWQYTSEGSIPGINGNVDMSYFYM